MSQEGFCSASEAARLLGVSIQQVRKMWQGGKIAGRLSTSNRFRAFYPREEIERLVASRPPVSQRVDPANYLTRKQAAKELSVSVKCLMRLVREGHITRYVSNESCNVALFDKEEIRRAADTEFVIPMPDRKRV